MKFYSTKQVGHILDVRPEHIQHLIWKGRLFTPQKSPGGHYIWTAKDIESAAWALGRTEQFTKNFKEQADE